MCLIGGEFCFEARLHFQPFRIEDAEVDGVAYAAGQRDEMFAKGAFLFCAETPDGGTRFFVEGVGFQFNTDAL